jgi:hypothetical protein
MRVYDKLTEYDRKKTHNEHIAYLEKRYGSNVGCECGYRVAFLIDLGSYAIEHPDEYYKSFYDCRNCQWMRMMRDPECTYRL